MWPKLWESICVAFIFIAHTKQLLWLLCMRIACLEGEWLTFTTYSGPLSSNVCLLSVNPTGGREETLLQSNMY